MTTPKTEKWFRVRFGFGGMDKVSIQENELEKALYAQKFGEVVQLGNHQVNGKYIIDISPNYHKYTGWFETYEPKEGDDVVQIERDCPNDLDNIIKEVRERVDWLVSHNQKHLIGKNIEIPELKRSVIETTNPEIKKITDILLDKFKI